MSFFTWGRFWSGAFAALFGLSLGSAAAAQTIAGIENLALAPETGAPPQVIIVGEWHGTREAPAFIEDLARHYAATGARVAVVLEQADKLNEVYLAAGRGSHGRHTLCQALAREMGMNRDGRSSLALAQLAVDLSDQRGQPGQGSIFVAGMGLSEPIPEDIDGPPSSYRRDYHAANIARYAAQADITLVLVGNMHPAALKRRMEERHGLPTLTLAMTWGPGEAWNCQRGRCAVHESGGNGPSSLAGTSAPQILDEAGRRHDRLVYLGRISASPPAVTSEWCAPVGVQVGTLP